MQWGVPVMVLVALLRNEREAATTSVEECGRGDEVATGVASTGASSMR